MDTSKCLCRLLPALIGSIVLQTLACSGSNARATRSSALEMPMAGTAPPVAGRSGAAGVCMPSTLGRPVAPSARILGVSADEMLEASVGTQPISLEWQAWWQAPPAVPDVRSLTLEVKASDAPYTLDCPLHIASNAVIRLHDTSGAIDVTFIGVIEAWGPEQFALHGDFQAAKLAAALAVPAPATGSDPDGFVFMANLASGAWQAQLGSRRHEAFCQLMRTPPLQDDECSAYISETQASRVVTLSSELADGVAAANLGDDFGAEQKRYLHWKDGSTSTLLLSVRPKGFACVNRPSTHDVVSMTADDTAAPMYVPRWRVVLPVDLHVETTDRRVNATLPGYVSATDAMAGWRTTARLRTLAIPMNHPILAEAMLGMDRAATGLSMLTASLWDSEAVNAPRGSVGVTAFKTDKGLPDFPPVLETTLDRATCFGTPVASMSRAASIDEER